MSSISCDPIAVCMYGWGKNARLYPDVVTLNGRLYELVDLEDVQVRYHRFLGISSARLILRFKKNSVVLRGIPNLAVVRQMASYLATYAQERLTCALVEVESTLTEIESSPVQEMTVSLDPLPLPADEKTHPLPLPEDEKTHPLPLPADEKIHSLLLPVDEETHLLPKVEMSQFWEYRSSQVEAASAITEAQPVLPEALTEELEVSITEPSRWKRQRELQERRRYRLRRLREERVVREHGFDVLALALRLRDEALPVVEPPANLLPGEVAHYRTEAMLCGEPLAGNAPQNRGRYRIKDQGFLILTSKRLLYLGRQRQITLSYERLREVLRTLRIVSFLGDNWGRRQLFEVRRPLEVTMYLEAVLQHYVAPISTDSGQVSSRVIPTTPPHAWAQGYERKILEQRKQQISPL